MKRLVLIGLLFGLSACAKSTPIIEKEYVRCKLPELPIIEYEAIPHNATYEKKLEVILNNCRKCQYERDLLREVVKLCQ